MEYIKLMFLSMVPVVELRGAIPLGIAIDLSTIYVYISCLICSPIIYIPIVLVFRQAIDYLRYRKYFNKIIRWVDAKIEGGAKKLKAASIIGLIIFVGVLLPTTGSWSGSALASIFKMRIKYALLGIFLGNAIVGAIMLTVSMHVAEGATKELLLMAIIAVIIALYTIKKKKKRSLDYEEVL